MIKYIKWIKINVYNFCFFYILYCCFAIFNQITGLRKRYLMADPKKLTIQPVPAYRLHSTCKTFRKMHNLNIGKKSYTTFQEFNSWNRLLPLKPSHSNILKRKFKFEIASNHSTTLDDLQHAYRNRVRCAHRDKCQTHWVFKVQPNNPTMIRKYCSSLGTSLEIFRCTICPLRFCVMTSLPPARPGRRLLFMLEHVGSLVHYVHA